MENPEFRYINYPISLHRIGISNPKALIDTIIESGVYWGRDKSSNITINEQIIRSLRAYGLQYPDTRSLNDAITRMVSIAKKTPSKIPFGSVKLSIPMEMRSWEDISTMNMIELLAYTSLRSCTGARKYAVLSNDLLIARMLGYARYNEVPKPLPIWAEEWNTTRKMRKIRKYLENNFGCAFYGVKGSGIRGVYASPSLSPEELMQIFGRAKSKGKVVALAPKYG